MNFDEKLRDDRLAVARSFQESLSAAAEFRTLESDWGDLNVASQKCVFLFIFERGEAKSYTLMIASPKNIKKEISFFILRQIRGARIDNDNSTPRDHARAVNTYMQDVLRGDFSFMSDYFRIERKVLDGLELSRKLDPSHAVRQKIRDFDISWLDDLGL